MRILAILGALVLGAALICVGAGGAIWYAKQQTHDSSTNTSTLTSVTPEAGSGGLRAMTDTDRPGSDPVLDHIDLEKIKDLLSLLDSDRRHAIVNSPERFAQFVRLEATNQSILKAAHANSADEKPAVRALMERARQKVLAEAYLNEVVRLNSDPGFPTEDNIKEFYEKNTESFRLPDRVHLWQIFLAVDADADAQAKDAVLSQAGRIVDALRKGKAGFPSMVKTYSAHTQSRVNDGYMGLLKMDELLPEVRAAVKKLKVGQVSDPVRSQSGYHIIKRGAFVAGTTLEMAQYADQIKKQLKQHGAQRIRKAAIEKIVASFPVRVPEDELEQWRANVRGEQPVPAGEGPDAGSGQAAQETRRIE